ncbi:MAG: glucosamine-6-phosphate deaminase [Oscillospiraceae bacterium]|nr:glucosamine-6-phosphate deaminase [Oscillospiraceae bacterium]
MIVKICKTKEEVGQTAAALCNAQIIKNPQSVLGLATGSSVLTTYQAMVKAYNDGITDYSQIVTYNLDEYCGLESTHPQSYCYFMEENLFKHINIKPENTNLPDGKAIDFSKESQRYEDSINSAGGIDLLLLGIGRNAHIAFNEPNTKLLDNTHRIELAKSTVQANARFFESEKDVPKASITMGIGTIMRSRTIVMVVSGSDKAEALAAMKNGLITPQCPASFLQLHNNVTVIVDEAAASQKAKSKPIC